jgi:hypothetical protein
MDSLDEHSVPKPGGNYTEDFNESSVRLKQELVLFLQSAIRN